MIGTNCRRSVAHEAPERIYFRGYNDAPFLYIAEKGEEAAFLGAAFEVDSKESLIKLSGCLNAPRRRGRIRTTDPDGRCIELVHGTARVEPLCPAREPVVWNNVTSQRRRGRFPIFELAPAPVMRLTHVVLSSPDPLRVIEWYVEMLGAYTPPRLEFSFVHIAGT